MSTDRRAKQLLTYSRQNAFKTCRKQHWYAYELGIRPTLDARALRMGHGYHAGLEQLAVTDDVSAAVEAIRKEYWHCPEPIDVADWRMEEETLLRLVCGYAWRWQDDRISYLAPEATFQIPLINPATGSASKLFDFAGKIDGIIQLEDQRKAVKESKLLGESLGSDSDIWRRLRFDHQISFYILAARACGHDVSTGLFDATRKPTIKPKEIPCLDREGRKIVLDRHGIRQFKKSGEPIITGNSKKGWELQKRMMSVEEWGEALNEDIASRPDYYYARVEVPRLDNELDECRAEAWEIQQTLREAQRSSRWYRTVNRNSCPFCSYEGPCMSGFDPREDRLPEGFEYVSNMNPELGEPNNVNCTPAAESSPANANAKGNAPAGQSGGGAVEGVYYPNRQDTPVP